MSFTNYETKKSSEPRVLTDEEKMLITDAFASGKGVTEIKHKYFFPSNLIQQSISHKKETEKLVVKLMSGLVVKSPAEYDIEGVLVKDAVMVAKPGTLAKLKSEMAKLKDCNILDYNIDVIIKSGTSAGTWTAFKECF